MLITSAAELSLWWAEVLSEPDAPDHALSLLWLDSTGHRLGRVLSVPGVTVQPDRRVIGFVRHLRDVMVEDSGDPVHLALALALSRSGRSVLAGTDREWAAAPRAGLDTGGDATWSLHVATARWITPVVEPPATRFHPHRLARRPPGDLLDRDWLLDQD
ncbi:hypothetical protein [Modestobacter sp. SYSU DS0511]